MSLSRALEPRPTCHPRQRLAATLATAGAPEPILRREARQSPHAGGVPLAPPLRAPLIRQGLVCKRARTCDGVAASAEPIAKPQGHQRTRKCADTDAELASHHHRCDEKAGGSPSVSAASKAAFAYNKSFNATYRIDTDQFKIGARFLVIATMYAPIALRQQGCHLMAKKPPSVIHPSTRGRDRTPAWDACFTPCRTWTMAFRGRWARSRSLQSAAALALPPSAKLTELRGLPGDQQWPHPLPGPVRQPPEVPAGSPTQECLQSPSRPA